MDKGTDKQYVAEFFKTQYNFSYLMFVPNFKILGQIVLEKFLTKISICIILEWEIEKGNQRTTGPVNAHLISWPSKAQNIQNLENIG